MNITRTYDRKNRLTTYDINQGDPRTLKWDALGRIREKTWTADETNYKQVFYHDGRTLMQIWDETVDGEDVTRTIAYDLYLGETGYLKDIDFNSEPDEEGYLVKDAQGSIRAIVNVTYAGGTYTVTTERYNTDGYGAWLDFDAAHTNGTHYMRYISCRVEDFCDSGSTNDNQALYHTDHRHYLPFLGIFLQREPLLVWPSGRSLGLSSNPAKLSPYRYAENSPTFRSDSTGLTTGMAGGNCSCCEADKVGEGPANYGGYFVGFDSSNLLIDILPLWEWPKLPKWPKKWPKLPKKIPGKPWFWDFFKPSPPRHCPTCKEHVPEPCPWPLCEDTDCCHRYLPECYEVCAFNNTTYDHPDFEDSDAQTDCEALCNKHHKDCIKRVEELAAWAPDPEHLPPKPWWLEPEQDPEFPDSEITPALIPGL